MSSESNGKIGLEKAKAAAAQPQLSSDSGTAKFRGRSTKMIIIS